VSDSYLWFYFPLVIAIMAVLEICRHDDPRIIIRRSLINSAILTGVLAGGALVLHLLGRYL
jgi:hypothetical protein